MKISPGTILHHYDMSLAAREDYLPDPLEDHFSMKKNLKLINLSAQGHIQEG
jgi:hypothetical protein